MNITSVRWFTRVADSLRESVGTRGASALLWFAMACLFGVAGCLVPYCARTVNHLPAVDLGCDPLEVHAFCLSITKQAVRDEGFKERWELCELAPNGNKTQAHVKTSYDFGLFAISPGTPPGFLIDTTHTLCWRLYRPGFKTVELDPNSPQTKIEWESAADVVQREEALDELFAMKPVVVAKGELPVTRKLEPGSKSKEHLAALQFGAAEYLVLVNAMGEPKRDDLKEVKARLIKKVGQLQYGVVQATEDANSKRKKR
jgi:hypothetical protein